MRSHARPVLAPVLVGALMCLSTSTTHAQAPSPTAAAPAAAPTVPSAAVAEASAPAAEASTDVPSLEEKRLVAYVATGVSAVSLITGITFGILAQTEFDCAKDVIACNADLQNKIVGEELFDVRSEIEQKALAADMAYLFAAASALVATVGYLQGFVFVEEDGAVAAAPAPSVVPVRLAAATGEVSR